MTAVRHRALAPLIRPGTLADFTYAQRLAPSAVICSGGTLVIPECHRLFPQPPIIDVRRIPELHLASGSARGAATTLTELAGGPGVHQALRAAAASVGSPAIRDAATIGGNIAAGSPGSVCAALVALRASARVLGPDGQSATRPVEDVTGRAAELIVSVTWDALRTATFAQVKVGASGAVAAVVAVSANRAGRDWTVAVAAESVPRRAVAIESMLNAGQRPDRKTIAALVSCFGDIAYPDYALIIATLIQRGLAEIVAKGGHGQY